MNETTTCPKCGVAQDPNEPVCIHMAGRKGGRRNMALRGPEFYRAIGKKGGGANAAAHGPEHFRAIGKKGGARLRELVALAKKIEEDAE